MTNRFHMPDYDPQWINVCESLIAYFNDVQSATISDIKKRWGDHENLLQKLSWMHNRNLIGVGPPEESPPKWYKNGGWTYPAIMQQLRQQQASGRKKANNTVLVHQGESHGR